MVVPRVSYVPPCKESLGEDAVEWCRRHGLTLDEEQEYVLAQSLGVRKNDRWAALEVAYNAPRQNGKGEVLMARELYGMFELEEQFIVHTAHEFKTSERHFLRVESAIRRSPELFALVKRSPRGRVIGFRYSHGDEAIELQDGRRIEFRTRTKSGMRGFEDVALLVLDEAMILGLFAHGSMFPTVRASKAERGPQIWYAGSAADQMVHDNAVVWAKIRQRGLQGDDASLAYFEWSLDFDNPDDVPEEVASNPVEWRKVNWAIEHGRVLEEHMQHEYRSIGFRQFVVELLGCGDYPSIDGLDTVFPLDLWEGLTDETSRPVGPVAYVFEVRPDRSRACIAAVGRNQEGKLHWEIGEQQAGTGWLVSTLERLEREKLPIGIVCDGGGPAASLVPELRKRNVTVTVLSTPEVAEACGMAYDAVMQEEVAHLGQQELLHAIKGAVQRPLGDRWVWNRRNSTSDVSSLAACTLGTWMVVTEEQRVPMFAFG